MKLGIVVVIALFFCIPVTGVSMPSALACQDKVNRDQDQSRGAEDQAYKEWSEARILNDDPKAIEIARRYIEQFPAGRYTSLLKKWIDSNQKLKESKRQAEELEQLMKSATEGRVDANVKTTDGKTVLMAAAEQRRVETVKALIQRGAEVNAKDEKHGWTALIYAIWEGDPDTVQALIDGGADVNVKDIDQATALDIAIIRDNPEIVKLLRNAGAR